MVSRKVRTQVINGKLALKLRNYKIAELAQLSGKTIEATGFIFDPTNPGSPRVCLFFSDGTRYTF